MMLPSEPERTRGRALGEGGACARVQLSWLLVQFHVFIISVNIIGTVTMSVLLLRL